MDPLKFLRHVPSRWLQIFDVLSRMIAQFDALRTFFSSLPSTEKKKKRVQDISSGLNSPDTIVYIHFITFALKPLKKFELQFQRSDVIINLLHANMTDLIGNTLTCFVKPEYVDNVKQMKDFQSIPESQQLSDKDLLIGESSRQALRNDHLTAHQIFIFYERVRKFYHQLIKSFVHYLPLGRRLLQAVQFIDPSKTQLVSEKDVIYASQKLGVNCDSDCLAREYRRYLSDSRGSQEEENIPDFWTSSDYDLLRQVAQRAMIIPHGNADTERLMSWLKRVVTEDRNRLQDASIGGLISVKSYLMSRGIDSSSIEINADLRLRCRNAKAAYDEYQKRRQQLENERKAQAEARQAKEKSKKEAEKRRREEAKAAEEIAEKKRRLAKELLAEASKLMEEASAIAPKSKTFH